MGNKGGGGYKGTVTIVKPAGGSVRNRFTSMHYAGKTTVRIRVQGLIISKNAKGVRIQRAVPYLLGTNMARTCPDHHEK
jgi:hypothetical protein